jgi:uncharacterized protein (DUF608 family)
MNDDQNSDVTIHRRDFLQRAAFAAVALMTGGVSSFGEIPLSTDPQRFATADKKLSPDRIKLLFDRGSPAVYRGSDLKFIGMPVGGLTCGQLYLGGDGKLWLWDIFNQFRATAEGHYAHPLTPSSPLQQGFALRVNGKTWSLDASGFSDVSFRGQYPIGTVEYRDNGCPLSVTLQAFSPFVPLNVDDSSLPVTVMQLTISNTGAEKIDVDIAGWLENKVCLVSEQTTEGSRENKIIRSDKYALVECAAVPPPIEKSAAPRPAIIFADFEGDTFAPWKMEGTAFGAGPAAGAPTAEQRLRGYVGKKLANSWALGSDEPTGKLTSPDFLIDRRFINFLIGGGNHPGKTCINLLIEGRIIRTSTGANSDQMEWASWDVSKFAGKTAHLEIVDSHTGGWGHIDIDQIEFADSSRSTAASLDMQADFGTMALGLLDPSLDDRGVAGTTIGSIFTADPMDRSTRPFGQPLIGGWVRKLSLSGGESRTVTFIISWCFPNLLMSNLRDGNGRHYATRFDSAAAVVKYISENFPRLNDQTKLWRDTWYDSTLPYWFLDRTFTNISTLATSTAYRFADGRFYGWEGVGSCAGTCTHVWHYEQAMGRLFPQLDILLRERADFDPRVGFRSDGMIDHRGECNAGQAVDGQAGTILRSLRDHQMSVDNSFLVRNWPSIRKAIEWLIRQDRKSNGILEGAQHNTLDAEWYGPVAWLSGLYLASLRAAEEMAREMYDTEFAEKCRQIFEVGQKNFLSTLFNGEYFINRPDPARPDAINSGSGCEIDQVFGQCWAFHVGLGRIIPEKETRSALAALWKFNFTPDAGDYRKVNKPGRWYAMPGEAGLLMCTFPQPDWDYEKARGKGPEWAAGYFNECMNGFEHQVAGHMIWEGMLQEGLAIERALHDRYHPSRRNPWNEVECGDHYARSMASYGVFIAACGYEYLGPRGHLAFAPRLNAENFKAAFTTAEGWGSYSQIQNSTENSAAIDLKWGQLKLKTLTIAMGKRAAILPGIAKVTIAGKVIAAMVKVKNQAANITFADDVIIHAGQRMDIVFL